MAHPEQQNFCTRMKQKYPEHFKNKKVLDIGSLDINGNNRFLFDNIDYVGLDLDAGNNVDIVSAAHLYNAPDKSFDVIISTEVFEHDMFYKESIKNIIRMLKDGGMFIFTCASTGRPEHGTLRTDIFSAPLLGKISNEWANYYKNLTEKNIREIDEFDFNFPDGYFEYNPSPGDLYFFGIKRKVKESFLITAYCDTPEKINTLSNCLDNLKQYNIDITVFSHYPLDIKIQEKTTNCFFSSNNPVLPRWNKMFQEVENYTLEIKLYDYAYCVMKLWREGLNFLKNDYDIVHVINYDANLISELYTLTMSNIKKYNKSIFYTNYTNFDLIHVINFSLLKRDFEYFIQNLTLNSYLKFSDSLRDGTLLPGIESFITGLLNDNFYKVSYSDWNQYVELFLKNELYVVGTKNNQIKLENGLYTQSGSVFKFTIKDKYNIFIGEYENKLAILLFSIKENLKIEISNLQIYCNSNIFLIELDKQFSEINSLEIKINDQILDHNFINKFNKLECKITKK